MDALDRRQGGLQGRRHRDRRGRRPEEAVQARRPRHARLGERGSAARPSSCSTSTPRRRCSTSATRSTSRSWPARPACPTPAPAPGRLDPAPDRAGAHRGAGGRQGRRRHPRGPLVPHHRPARLRVHRGAGGRVPDLQHVLDHRRPARPRAGAAAHARRDPPPGAQLGAARGARHRHRRPVVGIVAGLGFANAINELFKALGIDLPTTSLVLESRRSSSACWSARS